jgi:hypothetical protein
MLPMVDLEKSFFIGIGRVELPIPEPEPEKVVTVISTSINGITKALEKAGELAKPIAAKIVVAAVQVVPYSLPLDRPPIPLDFVVGRCEAIASRIPEIVSVSVYLCRGLDEAFKQIIKPDGVVVMGIRKSWWPTPEERWARQLQRAGHDVIFVNEG